MPQPTSALPDDAFPLHIRPDKSGTTAIQGILAAREVDCSGTPLGEDASVSAGPPAGDWDRELLAGLRAILDEETFERVAQLPSSTDEHIALAHEAWQARIARKQNEAAR